MKKDGKKETAKKVVGYRKSCKAGGAGLSHYIMIGKDTKEKE